MNHNEYLINLKKNLEINKKENDVVNFLINIHHYLNYISINYPYFRDIINQHLIKYYSFLQINECKLSSDLLKSFNYKNNKIEKLLKGGTSDINTERHKKLQEIKINEFLYLNIENPKAHTNKVREFLEILYKLKIKNPNYDDKAKYRDLQYIDSITFIQNAKVWQKKNRKDFDFELLKPAGNIGRLRDSQEAIKIIYNDIIVYYVNYNPDNSKHRKIESIQEDMIFNKLNGKIDHADDNRDNYPYDDSRWIQIYIYNNYKEYMENIPLLIEKFDTKKKCCCNDSAYFINNEHMSTIDKAKETYKNEIDFLKNFIYETGKETFMTIFDKVKRRRCDKCHCCDTNKHQIKITQLYHLLKYCIIYDTNMDISKTSDMSFSLDTILTPPHITPPHITSDKITKKNILDIFKKDTKLNCYETKDTLKTHNFKTLYEYIIENLISADVPAKKKNEQTDHINHYKYIANIRDYIINNFETNLFPIFEFPDLMVSNLNPKIFFFDFEINKIISIINKRQNYSFLIKYINNNYIIRNDIGFNYLKCLIRSYREILKTWYDAEFKLQKIHSKETATFFGKGAIAIANLAFKFLAIKDKKRVEDEKKPIVGRYARLIVDTLEAGLDFFCKITDEEKKLLVDLNTLMIEKQFIYKNAEWNKQNNQLKIRDNAYLDYKDLERSKRQIISKLNQSNLESFEFDEECRYMHYLLLSIKFLEEEEFLSIVESFTKFHNLYQPPRNHDPKIGGNNELSVNRRKKVSHKKIINKTNKIISKKKNNYRNRII